jgi:hypothetical protein
MSKISETHSIMSHSDSFLEEHAMLPNAVIEKKHEMLKKDSQTKLNEAEAVESSMFRLTSVVVLMVQRITFFKLTYWL